MWQHSSSISRLGQIAKAGYTKVLTRGEAYPLQECANHSLQATCGPGWL